MMGCKQRREGKLFYSSFSLDQRIRPDNPLRRIRALVDFSFVRPTVAERYGRRGNPFVDPIVLLKLMLILFLENIPSKRELMRRLPERLYWLWFCEYDLDSHLPNHSVLSKARRRCVLEGSFADAANNHGYKRARWPSRLRVEMQNLLIGAAQNLRKLIWALERDKRKSAPMAADLSSYIKIILLLRPFEALCQSI